MCEQELQKDKSKHSPPGQELEPQTSQLWIKLTNHYTIRPNDNNNNDDDDNDILII